MQKTLNRTTTPGSASYVPKARSLPLQWSLNPQGGPLQGPLDLGFFTGQTLCLDLSPTQVALVAGEGRLSRLFLGGHHTLPVGIGANLFSPAQSLIFLDLKQPFRFSLTRSDQVFWGQQVRRSLLGACSVNIQSPQAFYDTFLAGNEALDPNFIKRLLGQVIRSCLTEALAQTFPQADDCKFPELQDQLLRLQPSVLDPLCAPCGLVCTDISLYTSPPHAHLTDQLPTDRETAGQSSVIRHN